MYVPLFSKNFALMRKKTFILTCLFALLLSPAFAQFRKYSNEFLNIGAGARGLAMGGAQVATVEDGTAGYWNPAGVAYVKDYPSINLMHAEYFGKIGKFDYASLAIPVKNKNRALAFSLLRFAVEDIPNTLFLVEPDGSLNYNNIQSFNSADYAFLISYSQKLKSKKNQISFGGNAKVIYRSVGKFATAWGFGIDAGLQIRTKKWQWGIVVKDLTTTFNSWSFNFTDREKQVLYLTNNEIPVKSTELTAPRLTLGGARRFGNPQKFSLLAELNLDVTFDGQRNTVISTNPVSIDPRLGLEASVNNVFFVRAGIYNFQQALKDGDTTNRKKVWIYQPSLGAGFKVGNVSIDYALSNLANQTTPLFSHIFSLRLDLKPSTKKK